MSPLLEGDVILSGAKDPNRSMVVSRNAGSRFPGVETRDEARLYLRPKTHIPRRQQSILPSVPSNKMRSQRMQSMIFPAAPNFMQKKRAVPLTAVQVVLDASILAARRPHQRP